MAGKGRFLLQSLSKIIKNRDPLATKTEQQLPQLPIIVALDAPEKLPETIPFPSQPPTVVPSSTPRITQSAAPDQNVRKSSAAELLQRAEKEHRALGPVTKAGTHVKPEAGVAVIDKIPTNPFAETQERLKTGTPSRFPSGDLSGQLSHEQLNYKEWVQRKLKRLWNLPDVLKFNPNFATEVEVIVVGGGGGVIVVKLQKSKKQVEIKFLMIMF